MQDITPAPGITQSNVCARGEEVHSWDASQGDICCCGGNTVQHCTPPSFSRKYRHNFVLSFKTQWDFNIAGLDMDTAYTGVYVYMNFLLS